MNSKKVVLLCYYFPPNTSVGGRRWVKFCKYLVQQNIEITVFVPKKFVLKNQPSWQNELTKIKNIKIIEVNDFYPKALLDTPITLSDKLKYRISNLFVGFFTKGNKYDPSAFWNSIIKKKVKKYLLENGTKNLIVSGIPFNYFYYAAMLKDEMPDLNLLLDFRDLWVDSLGSFGENVKNYQPEKNYIFECKAEQFSIEKADHILCASDDIYDLLQKKYPPCKDKMQPILNGFDLADSKETSSSGLDMKLINGKIRIVYIGTINCSLSYYMYFIDALVKIKKENKNLYEQLQFEFYGNSNMRFQKEMTNAKLEIVRFYEKTDTDNVKNILLSASMVLYIKKEDELMNSFASKFFEYLCARKFILILSPEGKVTEYIRKNKIGYVMQKQSVYNDLTSVFNNFISGNLEFNSGLDISEFSYEVISKKITELLK